MAAKKPAATPVAASDAAETPPKRGKLLLIVTLVIVLLGGSGGAGWYFMKPADADAAVQAKPKPAVFLPLESFTVNLLPHDGQAQYIQAGLTLKLEDAEASDMIKQRMPEVRNRILMVLSAKRGPELLPVTGKQKLAEEIAQAVKTVIEPPKRARTTKSSEDEAKAADTAPAAEAAAADEKAGAAEGKRAAAEKTPTVEVLFTAFIIQ